MPSPRFQRSRAFKFAWRRTGSITVASLSWATADATLDLTLDAQVGDVIEAGINGYWGNEAIYGFLDFVTVVAGASVNAFSTAAAENNASNGAGGYLGITGAFTGVTGSVMYAVQAGDISSGTVTVRLRIRTSGAVTKTLYASAADPLQVWARNLGPPQP